MLRPSRCAWVTCIAVFCAGCCAAQPDSCARQDYEKCVKIADPLLRDPHLIFPDNMADIDLVCRRWSQFVECVQRYTDKCFTETRRQDFNKAIASPVDSVHQMCTETTFQKQYLSHAKCIKSTLVSEQRCGRHYKHLVEQVSGEVSRVSLCCSHQRFRACVLSETRAACDQGRDGGAAAGFARQVLDKALGFIRDQCVNYTPSLGYCPGVPAMGAAANKEMDSANAVGAAAARPPAAQPTGPAKPVMGQVSNPWMPDSRTTEARGSRDKWTLAPSEPPGSAAWLPAGRTSTPGPLFQAATTPRPLFQAATTPPGAATPTDSRPASFGRGMSFEPAASTEPADWLTHTWKVTSQETGKHKVDTWRPKAASFGGIGSNQLDEPNQQGLANRNAAAPSYASAMPTTALAALGSLTLWWRLV